MKKGGSHDFPSPSDLPFFVLILHLLRERLLLHAILFLPVPIRLFFSGSGVLGGGKKFIDSLPLELFSGGKMDLQKNFRADE